jgi:hypothetical protein
VRDLEAGLAVVLLVLRPLEPDDAAGNDVQALDRAELLALAEEELEPEADAQERAVLPYPAPAEVVEPARLEPVHRLPEGAVIDRIPWRASMLTGLPTHSSVSGLERLETWESLIASPGIEALADNGFRYVFVDEVWWDEMPAASREELSQPCVVIVSQQDKPSHKSIRRLLDIQNCLP